MSDAVAAQAPAAAAEGDVAPARAGLVLGALIAVAAVANLGLAVANVALPSIGQHFDASQTELEPHRGRLLARPRRVRALSRRDRRPVRPQAAARPRHGAHDSRRTASPRGRRRRTCSIVARIFGGLAAGMAYPTTLALITALWGGAARTRSIALWSAHRRRDRRARPALLRDPARALLVGLGLPADAAARGRRARAWRCSSSRPRERGDRARRQPRRDPLGRARRRADPRRSTSRRCRTRRRS